ncbi:hypothetical protein ACFQGT_00025 [Natrialbaceae archaeon GCM10025810]
MPEPTLPDACELPATVNGWLYDADDTSNGLVFRSRDHECSLGVFDTLSAVSVRVTDDRVRGFASNVDLERIEYDRDETDALRQGLAFAREWMETTGPAEWSHPDVCEAVFDAPPGYALETYNLENREAIVYYRRLNADVDQESIDLRAADPSVYTRETCPYLYVHEWRGSGNATVALAPWTNAHGPGSKYPELREVAETPDGCGLEVAVTVAREWAREVDGGAIDTDAAGQAPLSRWSA